MRTNLFKFLPLVLILAIALGWGSTTFLSRVTEWGHFIPTENQAVDYSMGILYAIAIGFCIIFWPIPSDEK